MFIGHYAPAFVAATLPKAPRLGTLFIAAQLTDLAFFAFTMVGIENLRVVPGFTRMNGMDLYDMPYTHSLVGAVCFGLAMALVIWLLTKNRTGAIIAGAVVVSHWFVDLLVHAPDLTLAGAPPKLGFGLWNYPLIEVPLELGITAAALLYYLARTGKAAGGSMNAVYILAGTLLALQLFNWLAPEPEAMNIAMSATALIGYILFIWLAYRADRTRINRPFA